MAEKAWPTAWFREQQDQWIQHIQEEEEEEKVERIGNIAVKVTWFRRHH